MNNYDYGTEIGNHLIRKILRKYRVNEDREERYFELCGNYGAKVCWLCGKEEIYYKDYCKDCVDNGFIKIER